MQATRERILHILKERGQVTVNELSQDLGLTSVTVRHHIDVLRSEGLVAAPVARRSKSPGRPKHVYALTEKADILFPKRYSHLISQILDEVRAHFSPDEVDQMMNRIGERMADQAIIPADDDFEARLVATIEFLDGLGYMPHWKRKPGDDGGYLIHIANCPYERAAHQDSEICDLDMTMLTRLLGVTPQRIASAVQGDHQCTYAISFSAR